jgi:hypothetical protein
MSGASGRQRVQERCFDGFLIVRPPQILLKEFSRLIGPNFPLIQQLHLQVQNLRRTRDLLLPRLLSGTIDIPDVIDPTSFSREMGTRRELVTEMKKSSDAVGIATKESR